MNDELEDAIEDYVELFQAEPLTPLGIPPDKLAAVLRDHVRRGEPVPEEFDWWADLPDGADA